MNRLHAAVALLLAASVSTTFALPGRVVGWGNNELGQAATWNDPPAGATAIAAGGAGGLALMSNTTVIAWGDTTFNQDKPPLFLTNVIAVAMGSYHGLALVNNGTVVGWGANGNGQTSPPGGLTNVTKIAAGGEHSLALRGDGIIIGWGNNSDGQANPPAITNFVAIAAGDKFSAGLLNNGSILAWGDNANGQVTTASGITNAIKIAAGERHGLALLSDGHVAGWGDNSNAQANPPPSVSNAIAIAAGGKHSLALLSDSTVRAWGDNSSGQAAIPPGLSNVIAIAAGDADSYALRIDGSIVRWGRASLLVKFPAIGIDNAILIAGGGSHSLAARDNGLLEAWGDNQKGQCNVPGGLTNVTDLAAGIAHSLALADGNVWAWGDNSNGQSSVPGGLTGIVDVAAGNFFSLAVRPNGTIAHWGNAIGLPSPSVTDVVAVAAGGYHALALLTNGTVIAWGDNSQGQTSVPGGLTGVVGVAAGEYFSVARRGDGSITAWGNPGFGLNSAPFTTNAIDIAAGRQHAMALKADGGIASWGDNYYQQIPAPAGATPAMDIAAGELHSLGIFSIPPTITSHPSNVVATAGFISPFAVSATGTPPLQFQWRFNGTDIPAATQSSYIISNTQPTNAGNYDVIVWNNAGSVTSSAANLMVLVPPSISSNPANQSVVLGSFASFNVFAAGTAPLQFQWRQDGAILGGATNPFFSINNVATTNAGNYDVIVSNTVGTITSAVASLTVLVPPSISVDVANLTVVTGNVANFFVTAAGTAPLSYQWWKGTAIGGATASNYTIGSVAPADAGNYYVVVSNVAGMVTSSVATLTVLVSPSISSNPTGQSVVLGNAAAFGVAAAGSAPLYFQWRHDGSILGGATNATFGIGSVATNDAGNYDVIVSNAAGSITSAAGTLVVLVAPTISSNPASQSIALGGAAAFGVLASGSAPLTYQWRHNGSPLGGETNAGFVIAVVATNHAGNYDVIVANTAGSVTSAPATLTVLFPPSIQVDVTSLSVVTGNVANFFVTAAGTAPLSYQWWKGTAIGGATASNYTIGSVAPADAGNYYVVVSNVAGMVTSSIATLTVLVSPSISSNPASQSVVLGNAAAFGVNASGSAPLYFQWRHNGSILGGATNATFGIGSVATNDAGTYNVIVSNAAGSVTSAAATLTVLLPPSISIQPANLTVPTGGVANFFVTASGAAPLFYQWVKGTPIGGATASNYTIASATVADAGNFYVIVTNNAGAITSSVATLTVLIPPSITTQPIGGALAAGGVTTLVVAASGSPTLAYQWRRNGSPIAAANSVQYTIPSATALDAGNYDVVVTNDVGSVTSSIASIIILGAPQITMDPVSRRAWDGVDVQFNALAVGSAPLAVQWQYNETDLPGETATTLLLANVTTGQVGRYRMIASNPNGAVTSATAILVVRNGAATGLRNDFDGDGRTDIALTGPVSSRWVRTVYVRGQWRTFVSKRHPISSAWFLMQSTDGYRSQEFGWTTDRAIPGDYDGDHRTDLAIYRPDTASWYIIDSSLGAIRKAEFGRPGAVPLSGDFDRDGVTDLAFFDRSTGDWVVERSSDGAVQVRNWGWNGALPVPGDYDGDGATDLAVYDPAAGNWYIQRSSDGQIHRQNWGWAGVDPAQGDYDGDGITDITAYDPATTMWFVQRSGSGTMWRQAWGVTGGVPVPGDYDGDTIIDIAVYDPILSRWSILKSTDGQPLGGGPQQFGSPDTKPATTQTLP